MSSKSEGCAAFRLLREPMILHPLHQMDTSFNSGEDPGRESLATDAWRLFTQSYTAFARLVQATGAILMTLGVCALHRDHQKPMKGQITSSTATWPARFSQWRNARLDLSRSHRNWGFLGSS